MTWYRLPLFIWSHYATSLIMILARGHCHHRLFGVERLAKIGIFDPALGAIRSSFNICSGFIASGCVHHGLPDGRRQ